MVVGTQQSFPFGGDLIEGFNLVVVDEKAVEMFFTDCEITAADIAQWEARQEKDPELWAVLRPVLSLLKQALVTGKSEGVTIPAQGMPLIGKSAESDLIGAGHRELAVEHIRGHRLVMRGVRRRPVLPAARGHELVLSHQATHAGFYRRSRRPGTSRRTDAGARTWHDWRDGRPSAARRAAHPPGHALWGRVSQA